MPLATSAPAARRSARQAYTDELGRLDFGSVLVLLVPLLLLGPLTTTARSVHHRRGRFYK